ncbi:hypothetical protein M426DRAFT_256386 [Hypoxylon sp. CI-4A]|nr:hypothetical protein M426DRAFT_256386 [Hypoxylon sp. CI-4A]
MGKRIKKTYGANRPKRWSTEEEHHLLAWLDHCIRHAVRFDNTIATHIRAITKQKVTAKQCKDKVNSLWSKYGREGSEPSDIWLEGSSSLSGLEDEEKQQILELRYRLESSSLRTRLRSSSVKPSDPEPKRYKQESCQSSPLSSLRSTPSVSADSIPDSDSDQYRISNNLFEHNLKRHVSSSLPLEAPDKAASATGLKGEGNRPAPTNGIVNGSYYTPTYRSTGVQHDELIDSHLPAVSAEDIEKQIKLMSEKEAKIKAQQHQIFNLEGDLTAAQKDHNKLLRQIEIQGHSANNAGLIYNLQKTNSILKEKLLDKEASESGGRHIQENSLGPTASAIRQELDSIEDRIAKSCLAFGCSSSSTAKPLSESSTQLQKITARLSGMSIQKFNEHLISAKVSESQLLRSLVAALVCELAFVSSFPDLLDTGPLLLQGYREQILMHGDRSTLESIDFLAHNSLFSSEYFMSRLVPEKASEMALEVSQLLAGWDYHISEDQFFGPASEVSQEDLFQPVFSMALSLKLQLLLSKTYYTLVFPSPGTVYDPEIMVEHGWRSKGYATQRRGQLADEDEASARPDRTGIKICLFPALYAYHKHRNEGNSYSREVEEHVVSYRNFLGHDDDRTTGEYTVISKAVVQI